MKTEGMLIITLFKVDQCLVRTSEVIVIRLVFNYNVLLSKKIILVSMANLKVSKTNQCDLMSFQV